MMKDILIGIIGILAVIILGCFVGYQVFSFMGLNTAAGSIVGGVIAILDISDMYGGYYEV